MTLIVRNKIQGLDVKSFSGVSNIVIKEHCKEYVNGMERKQDCFCIQFPSGNFLVEMNCAMLTKYMNIVVEG